MAESAAVVVLASFVGGWGHAEPLIETAQLAAALGHHVTFAGQQAVLPRLSELGFDTAVVGPDTLGTDRLPLQRVDRDRERKVVREHFVKRFGSYRAAAIGRLLDQLESDTLLCDEVDVGAIAAAELLGVPSVTVNVAAAGRLVSPRTVGDVWNELRAELGLTIDADGTALGGSLMLAPFPASFRDPALPDMPQWRPVRPTVPRREPGTELSARVYATLGTVFNVESGDLLSRLITGLGSVGVPSLVTVGPHIEPIEFAPAPQVRVEQFVPQHQVLAGCRAVVCHGGSGSLMAALAHGVPVVLLPMGADQPDNADRCEQLGCGLVLDPVDATAGDIATAIQRVIEEPSYGISAGRLADEVAAQPPVADLPELIGLLRRRTSPA
ncbi:MAG TPA: glycosyltransferase [Ilumatobacter sp.]|nr:glycosyltransferase [Ilumatobacter sp.]